MFISGLLLLSPHNALVSWLNVCWFMLKHLTMAMKHLRNDPIWIVWTYVPGKNIRAIHSEFWMGGINGALWTTVKLWVRLGSDLWQSYEGLKRKIREGKKIILAEFSARGAPPSQPQFQISWAEKASLSVKFLTTHHPTRLQVGPRELLKTKILLLSTQIIL